MPARKEVEGDLVRQIRFEGNGGLLSGQNNRQLRLAMEQRQSQPLTFLWPFMYVMQPVRFDAKTLELDSQRLRVWYAHHGWFDAKFSGWEVRRVRRRWLGKAGVIDIIGHVAPGAPSFVRSFETSGAGPAAIVLRGALNDYPVEVGSQFSLDVVEASRQHIVGELRENGYAYAKAEADVDVYPEEHAVDVSVRVEAGQVARVGEVTVEGLETIEPSMVLDSLTFEPYDPERPDETGRVKFRPSLLRSSQQRIFDTNYFSLVDIIPDLSDPTALHVPIRIRVAETSFRRFRLGAGVEFDFFRLGPQLDLELRDVRFAGSAVRAEAKGGVGAIIGVAGEDQTTGTIITGLAELRLDYPWFMRRKLGLGGGVRFEQDAQFGSLPFWTIEADLTLRREIGESWAFTTGLRWTYFQYGQAGFRRFDPGSLELDEVARLQFGGDFSGTNYRLLTFDAALRLDTRDNQVTATRGALVSLKLRQSLPIPELTGDGLDNSFLYTEVGADLRRWWRVVGRGKLPPLVFAGRLQTSLMVPWGLGGRFDALPYPELAFLGGPNSLRGFRANQIGPYDAVCLYEDGRPHPQHNNGEPYDVDLTYLPRGGAFAVQGSAELRAEWKYGVSFAVFTDVGILAQRVEDLATSNFVEDLLRYDAGVGVRANSPIGPLRLDIGLRPLFKEDLAGPSSTYGCNTIDRAARPYDLVSAFQNVRRVGDGTFPMAINVVLAIGEAF